MPTCDDLATKAELQELRDQLNAVLGDKEDGGRVEAFVKGQGTVATIGAMLGTVFIATKERAANAVMDIVLDNPVNDSIWRDLANGNAKWSKVKGSGVRTPLPDLTKLGKTAGSGATISSVTAKTTAASGQGIGILANLAAIGTTLALSKATVDIFDQRVEAESKGSQLAIDAVNAGMLRLYQKNQESISATNEEIEQIQSHLQNQNGTITDLQFDVASNQVELQGLSSDLDLAATRITILERVSAESSQQIQELEGIVAENDAEARAAIDALTATVTELNSTLELAKDTLAKQEVIISKLDERVAYLEQFTEDLAFTYGRTDADLQLLKFEFTKLQEDLNEDRELTDARADLVESKLIILQHRLNRPNGGSGFATGQAATAQTGLLELTNKLSDPALDLEPVPTTITKEELENDPQTFRDRFEQLLDRIKPNAVTPEQLAELQTGIRTDVGTDLAALLGSTILPRLDDLTDATSEPKIAKGVQTGICNSLNGGSCPGAPVQGLQGMNNATQSKMDDISAKLGIADLLQGNTIAKTVNRISDTVHHGTWGLEKIQGFASTAWKATHADKVMNALTLVASLHNAAMLSRNLGETLGELTSQALATIGIKDSENSPLDINAAIGKSINSLMTSILGAEVYQGVKETWNKSSRIISSASQIVWTVRSIADSAREVTEWTAENTGKIGNALKKFRVVGENAYNWMPEKVTATNKWLSKVDKLKEGVDSLDDAASSFSSVLGEVQNIQQESQEIKEQGDKFKENVKLIQPKEREQNKPVEDARALELEASKSPSNTADVFRGEGETE
jgi:hypothetical protein